MSAAFTGAIGIGASSLRAQRERPTAALSFFLMQRLTRRAPAAQTWAPRTRAWACGSRTAWRRVCGCSRFFLANTHADALADARRSSVSDWLTTRAPAPPLLRRPSRKLGSGSARRRALSHPSPSLRSQRPGQPHDAVMCVPAAPRSRQCGRVEESFSNLLFARPRCCVHRQRAPHRRRRQEPGAWRRVSRRSAAARQRTVGKGLVLFSTHDAAAC